MSRRGWSRDPALPSLLLFAALTVGGFVMIALGWRVAARTLFVPFQTPALVSGGLGGLALILVGTGLSYAQITRRLAASEHADTEALLDEAAATLDALGQRRPR